MRWNSSRWLPLLTGWLLTGCGEPPPPAGPPAVSFYHWESTLAPDSTARALLAPLGDNPLFLRVFDVAWENGRAYPRAELRIADTTGLPPVVPVVFLTNEVMERISETELPTLARDVSTTINQILGSTRRHPEVQFDCDWTAGTRDRYFTFLSAARDYFSTISATVRLHQYRDRATQGIPPVDRGVLMAYNTGNLDDWATENSILDTSIVKSYLRNQPSYPLPLDVAVAVYDWAAVYRRNRLAYLINEPPLAELADTSFFRPLGINRYEVVRSTYYDGLYLYRGDRLRLEAVSPAEYPRTAALVRRYVSGGMGQRLILYRLGSRLWDAAPAVPPPAAESSFPPTLRTGSAH